MQSGSARVAIITRTKNRTLLLRRAVDSVLSQTFGNWVHVVVNDGGDPGQVDALLGEYESAYAGRLQVVHHPVSLGMEAASNAGAHASQSDYLVIHDDDDSWDATFLQRCVEYLDTPPAVLGTPVRGVATYSMRILEQMHEKGAIEVGREPFNEWMTGVSLYRLAASNCIPPISFLFSRESYEKIGGFREDLPVLGDWDFHLRFVQEYEIGLIRETLANYHHRVTLEHGVYGNSVIAGDDKHRRYEHLYRNELLRDDLRKGRAGLGFLVNTASSFEVLHNQFNIVERIVARLRRISLLRWFNNRLRRQS